MSLCYKDECTLRAQLKYSLFGTISDFAYIIKDFRLEIESGRSLVFT